LLPTDIKNCYLNNKEVQSLWLGGKEIWTLVSETTGLGTGGFAQFNDWASLSAITQAGQARDYFSVGDEFTVTNSRGTVVSYMVVAIDHEGNNGLMMMSKQIESEIQWSSSDTTSKRRYSGSNLPNGCNIVGSWLPTDLQAIVQNTKVKYNYTVSNGTVTNSGSVSTATYKYWIPSICEIFTVDEVKEAVRSVVGTQWEFFQDAERAKTFIIPNYVRCRDTDCGYPARNATVYNTGSGWRRSSVANSSVTDMLIVFRI
jgi:hypothetical protein